MPKMNHGVSETSKSFTLNKKMNPSNPTDSIQHSTHNLSLKLMDGTYPMESPITMESYLPAPISDYLVVKIYLVNRAQSVNTLYYHPIIKSTSNSNFTKLMSLEMIILLSTSMINKSTINN